MHAYANRSAQWAPDRRSILFLSNRDGGWKAYVAPWTALDLPPTEVASPPSAVLDASFHPNGRGVFFVTDTGAGPSLFLAALGKRSFHAWGPRGLSVVRAPRRPSLARSTVYLRATNPERLMIGSLTAPAHRTIPLEDASFAATSAGGARVLLSATDRVEEWEGGGQRHVRYRPKQGTKVRAATYSPDGKSLLVGVGGEEGQIRVLRVAKPGRPATVVFDNPDPNAEIVQLSSSARSQSIAALFRSHAGMTLYLLQPNGWRKARKVALPEGVGALGEFSRDGRVLTVTWETPLGPSDIFEVATDSARLRKLRDDVRPALASLDPMSWRRERITEGDASLEATIYAPISDERPAAKHPAVLLLGDDGAVTPAWRPAVRFLVGIGLVVIEPWISFGRNRETLTTGQVVAWMDAMDRWLPEQPWWEPNARAVIAGPGAATTVLDAIGRTRSPWSAVVRPRGDIGWKATERDVKGWRLLVGTGAPRLVDGLREAGIAVEYAATLDEPTRLAREALFLQRAFADKP